MKKIFSFLFALTLAFALIGCGGKTPTPSSAPSVEESAPSVEESAPSVEESEQPSETPSVAPSAEPDSVYFDAVLPFCVAKYGELEMDDDWIDEPIAPVALPLAGKTLPTPSARDGYVFSHWSKEYNGEAVTPSSLTEPAILYAVWQTTEVFTPVTTEEEFLTMQADGFYVLTADITVTQPYATSFTGVFDGNGHTVTLAVEDSESAALFRKLDHGGKVYGVEARGSVKSEKTAAAIAVENYYGVIFRCSFEGTVSGEIGAGGILYFNTGHVALCKTKGTVEGNGLLGGVCGTSDKGKFYYCTSSATVKNRTTASVVGGICGDLSYVNFNVVFYLSRADYCYFNGTLEVNGVKTSSNAGGIAGRSLAFIYDCYADFSISAIEPFGHAGGVIGSLVSKLAVYGELYQTVSERCYYAPTCTYYNEKDGVQRPDEQFADPQFLAPDGFVSEYFSHSRVALGYLSD